jgi:hypothetical protein
MHLGIIRDPTRRHFRRPEESMSALVLSEQSHKLRPEAMQTMHRQ